MLTAIRKSYALNYCFKLGRTAQRKCLLKNALTHRSKFQYVNPKGNFESNQSKQPNQPNGNKNGNYKRDNRGSTLVKILGVCAFAYLCYQDYTYKPQPSTPIVQESNLNPIPQIGGSWQLKDFNSQPFGSENLKGWNYLIYFGFAKCPDICPTTLMYISSFMRHLRSLPDYKDVKLKVVFVSLDPQRDTPQRLKKWLSSFDQDIIGVLGQSEVDKNLQKIKKDFKIYANKIYTPQDEDPQNQSGYKIDHTALVYLMNQKNEYLDLLNLSFNQKKEAERLLKKLQKEKSSEK